MAENVSMDRMQGALGSLLLLWAAIENAMRSVLHRADPDLNGTSYHGAGSLLAAWGTVMAQQAPAHPYEASLAASLCADLKPRLTLRNGICHGLTGISASQPDRSAKVTWLAGKNENSITWEDLQAMFAWLSKIPSAIDMMSHCVGRGRKRLHCENCPNLTGGRTNSAFIWSVGRIRRLLGIPRVSEV